MSAPAEPSRAVEHAAGVGEVKLDVEQKKEKRTWADRWPPRAFWEWFGGSVVVIFFLWAVLTGYFIGLFEAGLAVRGQNYQVLTEDVIHVIGSIPSYSDQPPFPWTLAVPGPTAPPVGR